MTILIYAIFIVSALIVAASILLILMKPLKNFFFTFFIFFIKAKADRVAHFESVYMKIKFVYLSTAIFIMPMLGLLGNLSAIILLYVPSIILSVILVKKGKEEFNYSKDIIILIITILACVYITLFLLLPFAMLAALY